MKTKLPKWISTEKQAVSLITRLFKNGEGFHPEDDAFDVAWNECEEPTDIEKRHLNKLMSDMYALPNFDPCETYVILLHKRENNESINLEKIIKMNAKINELKTALGSEMIDTYQIGFDYDCVAVHSPAYVNIDFDDEFKFAIDDICVTIKNDKVCVTLWRKSRMLHITVY